ncbi:peptidase S8 [Xylanibacillus composti]|uniref:SLH domain-containing protein n=1 Tax=Xylanibacillus composti TaxID=1572762 RepID=A0A8J4H6W8_9BACL|nr:S8 family serine peptidase [Xylanibacillus composti]MDT9725976.1 peptidase S8 [Xylanibacillus composti]GIQ70870.1 hypothetical protein XYCOK13_36940 [Xylanibacillus composti]
MKGNRVAHISVILVLLLLLQAMADFGPALHAETDDAAMEQSHTSADAKAASSWIIKWAVPLAEMNEQFVQESTIVKQLADLQVVEAMPKPGVDAGQWAERWSQHADVVYLHDNRPVQLAAAPNDPLYTNQNYLKQIGMEAAWEHENSNADMVIAVVDTGVDLNHPDLKDRITGGINLLNKNLRPQDDNGHGTNVAGIIAAVSNNQIGVSGMLWDARIMPVKVMDSKGSGDEMKLGEGIKYAVDEGAKIIVLSLGLFKYSQYLKEVVDYAEDKGVLLVAATGNEGQSVKYPAAYHSVVAVGGVRSDNQPEPKSNSGPEIDLVAPYRVFTTSLGGGYGVSEGTSMAAPQVAAAAALIWKRYPDYKPYQVRSLLQQSAQNLGSPGWDERTGYGLLRVDRALTIKPEIDFYEPNDRSTQAKTLPVDTQISASFSSSTDVDWYSVQIPYKGTLEIKFPGATNEQLRSIALETYVGGAKKEEVSDLTKGAKFSVEPGTVLLRARLNETARAAGFEYRLETYFHIYRDAFENNDKQYLAYSLPARDHTLKATFHQVNDVDWYMIHVKEKGTLQIRAEPDTYRMDLELMVQRMGENGRAYDYTDEGETEYTPKLQVEPGYYYIRVRNLNYQSDSYPVRGEYTLSVNYLKTYEDPNEPNDKTYQATTMVSGRTYEGVMYPNEDVDWFVFNVTQDSYASFLLDNIPKDRTMSLAVLNSSLKQMAVYVNDEGDTSISHGMYLAKGTYYLRLQANRAFDTQMYRVRTTLTRLVSGFRDIQGHWAEKYIVDLASKDIVSGYPDFRFAPNGKLTRAEATFMLVQALSPSRTNRTPAFKDVNRNHWAYEAIAQASAEGWIAGYPDGTFAPNKLLTRMEMAVLLSQAMQVKGIAGRSAPFKDVPGTQWGADRVRALKQLGWISGYEDNTFRPGSTSTRAEFVSMLYNLVNRKK